jgi:hypothetical protein
VDVDQMLGDGLLIGAVQPVGIRRRAGRAGGLIPTLLIA